MVLHIQKKIIAVLSIPSLDHTERQKQPKKFPKAKQLISGHLQKQWKKGFPEVHFISEVWQK